jgi:hypothetical protein
MVKLSILLVTIAAAVAQYLGLIPGLSNQDIADAINKMVGTRNSIQVENVISDPFVETPKERFYEGPQLRKLNREMNGLPQGGGHGVSKKQE